MKNIGIKEPCTENWNEMSPTEKGAFCQKCAKQVYDFTNKSNQEIKSTLRNLVGQSVCGRITSTQEQSLNMEFEAWQFNSKRSFQSALVFSLIVVFGFTLFSCEDDKEKETIKEIQTIAMNAMSNSVPEIKQNLPTELVGMVEPELMEMEIITMGVMESIDHIEPNYIIQNEIIEISEMTETHDIHMVGAMVMTCSYENYLIDKSSISSELELDENGVAFPTEFASKIYPNPAVANTNLEISVPKKDRFEISLFDMSGKFIQTIYKGKMDRGTFTYQFDMTDLITGTYFVVINSDDYQETVQVVKF